MGNDFLITRKKINFVQKDSQCLWRKSMCSFDDNFVHLIYNYECDTIAHDIEMELTHKKNEIKPMELRFIYGSLPDTKNIAHPAYSVILARDVGAENWNLIRSNYFYCGDNYPPMDRSILINKIILVNDNLEIIKVSDENNKFLDILQREDIPTEEDVDNEIIRDVSDENEQFNIIFDRKVFNDVTMHLSEEILNDIYLAKLFFNMTISLLKTNKL